ARSAGGNRPRRALRLGDRLSSRPRAHDWVPGYARRRVRPARIRTRARYEGSAGHFRSASELRVRTCESSPPSPALRPGGHGIGVGGYSVRRAQHLGCHRGDADDPLPPVRSGDGVMNDTALSALLRLMERLRDPERGCPWDREQTFATIAPYTIEEAYE